METVLQLEIEGEFKLASVKKRPHDGEWKKSSRHVIVLHQDLNHVFRTVDPASIVGYGYGTVGNPSTFTNKKLSPINGSLIYQDITPLTKDEISIISKINEFRHLYYTGMTIDIDKIRKLKNDIFRSANNEHIFMDFRIFIYRCRD